MESPRDYSVGNFVMKPKARHCWASQQWHPTSKAAVDLLLLRQHRRFSQKEISHRWKICRRKSSVLFVVRLSRALDIRGWLVLDGCDVGKNFPLLFDSFGD